MTLPRVKKKCVAVGLATGLVVGAGGIAAAYFTAPGSGSASAAVGTPMPFHVAQFSVTGTMYPGSGATYVTFTVTNTGTGNEHASNTFASVVSKGGDITSHGNTVARCLASWFHATASPLTATLLPGTFVHDLVRVTMSTSGTTQGACRTTFPRVVLTVAR